MINIKKNLIQEDITYIVNTIGNDWKKIEGSKFLISGSNGLLGSYIVDTIKFLNDNYFKKPISVTCINRNLPSKESRNYNLFSSNDLNFKFIANDLTFDFQEKYETDYVIHAAGDSSPYKFQKNRLDTLMASFLGTKNLLKIAKQNKSRKFLYFSSGAVYGQANDENLPIKETFLGNLSTQDPRACYAETKRMGETLCNIYDEDFDTPTLIARIFVVYGPGMNLNDKKVITDFIHSAITAGGVELKSNGQELRSDTYVSDAICGIWKMILSPFRNEIFNIGSNYPPYTLLKLAKIIHKTLGISNEPKISSAISDIHLSTAPKNFYADVSKIAKLLNHSNKISIESGMKRTIEWYLNK